MWMESNKITLNGDKTEVMFFTPRNYNHSNPVLVSVGDSVMSPTTSVKNRALSMDINGALSMDSHITSVTTTCYMHLIHASMLVYKFFFLFIQIFIFILYV